MHIPPKEVTMESLIFSVSAVLPIILTVAVGYVIRRMNMIDDSVAKVVNRLVFRVFLPVLIFLNIYKIESITNIDVKYIIYAAAAVIAIFLLGIPLVMLITKSGERRGPLLQSIFRSNYALIGLPLAESLFGSEGLACAALLSAVGIPLFNILAVISLSVFRDGGEKPSVKKILLDIIKNPLIDAIAAGLCVLGARLALEKFGVAFRLSDMTPIFKALEYLADLATPLALLMLGAQFSFSAVSELRRELIFGVLTRSVSVPLLGLGIAYIFFGSVFSGAEFAALVAVFSTPVAVSSVPMAQEMGADTSLAGQLVVWTTPVSAITVFAATFLLKSAGIF